MYWPAPQAVRRFKRRTSSVVACMRPFLGPTHLASRATRLVRGSVSSTRWSRSPPETRGGMSAGWKRQQGVSDVMKTFSPSLSRKYQFIAKSTRAIRFTDFSSAGRTSSFVPVNSNRHGSIESLRNSPGSSRPVRPRHPEVKRRYAPASPRRYCQFRLAVALATSPMKACILSIRDGSRTSMAATKRASALRFLLDSPSHDMVSDRIAGAASDSILLRNCSQDSSLFPDPSSRK